MACPFFEPLRPVSNKTHPRARLPLIQEFEGLCHATAEIARTPASSLFVGCNHGHQHSRCDRFPAGHESSTMRYSVVGHSASILDILVIEEIDYAPVNWVRMQYSIESRTIEPEPADVCVRAQVAAFCSSYLSLPPEVNDKH